MCIGQRRIFYAFFCEAYDLLTSNRWMEISENLMDIYFLSVKNYFPKQSRPPPRQGPRSGHDSFGFFGQDEKKKMTQE